jgi:hypothetical protein
LREAHVSYGETKSWRPWEAIGLGEGWKGSHSAADSHIFFLEICREFGGHKNFVLHPVHFLLTLRARDRQQLLILLEALAENPMQKGNLESEDDVGNSIHIKVSRSLLISCWPDALIKELRVINIERI